MSTLTLFSSQATTVADPERWHRFRVYAAAAAAIALVTAIALYGADYYVLGAAERPFSAKHVLLRPSGTIGIKLGFAGVGLFLIIFLYPLRKRIPWLARIGKSKHWLDFHVILGLTAPVIIAFHSSFKFHGIAGMAFWIMAAVAASGIVGRYIYAQIPRSLDSAEISMKELEKQQQELTSDLGSQRMISATRLQWIARIPTVDQVRRMPLYRALLLMIAIDLVRPFHVARLRREVLGFGGVVFSLGGLLRTDNEELEFVVQTARHKSALSKRIAFLSRTQQVFHLWHVIHRPFSYGFVVLALIHIGVALLLGYI
jgi:hypothetical protein